ncbi:hypothetical protein Tco_0255699 [Tanacetum coccineum]
MATLKFTDTHNVVTFLSKPKEYDGFEQIVDFLNSHPIKYALTVNPTIYTSCIEQFWSTVKIKTINKESQLHAQVDDKKIIITEASVRRDLQLADENGIGCLPNSTIFEQLALIGKPKRKNTQVPQPSGFSKHVVDEAVHKELGDSLVRAATTASSFEAERDSGNINKTQSKATPNESSFLRTTSGGGPRKNHFAAKSAEEKRNKPPTQAQQRKIICSYLKNMEGKKLKDLQNKSFDSIQKMFDKAFKRQKVDEDKDTAELQSLMEVIPDEEEVTIDVVPLATKPPSIGTPTITRSSQQPSQAEANVCSAIIELAKDCKRGSKKSCLLKNKQKLFQTTLGAKKTSNLLLNWAEEKRGTTTIPKLNNTKPCLKVERRRLAHASTKLAERWLRTNDHSRASKSKWKSFQYKEEVDLDVFIAKSFDPGKILEGLVHRSMQYGAINKDTKCWNRSCMTHVEYILVYADLHAGRKEISSYATYNYRYAEQEASGSIRVMLAQYCVVPLRTSEGKY